MKYLLNKIKSIFSPKLIKVVVLPTGIIVKHYQCWNRIKIVIEDQSIANYKYHKRWNLQ